MTQQQIKDQYNEKNTTYADAAAIAVTRIAETASEQEKQNDNYQDQVRYFLQVAGIVSVAPMKLRSFLFWQFIVQLCASTQHHPFEVPCSTRYRAFVRSRSGMPQIDARPAKPRPVCFGSPRHFAERLLGFRSGQRTNLRLDALIVGRSPRITVNHTYILHGKGTGFQDLEFCAEFMKQQCPLSNARQTIRVFVGLPDLP